MSSFLRDLISVSVVLGIMIFVHEWGHFIAAKLFGVRVDVFSFGFGPRLFGVKCGDTDYRLSALPFGGYVRVAGDNVVEEGTDVDYEHLSKPRLQRVLIAIAGPAMSVLLAFLIFWGIYGLVGVPFEPDLRQPADVVAVPTNPPITSGVKPGDRIVAVNGEKTLTWEKVLALVNKAIPGSTLSVTVDRAGSQQTFAAPIPNRIVSVDSLVGYPKLTPVVDDVSIGFPAEKAGLKSGDFVVSVDGNPVSTWYQIVNAVHQSDSTAVRHGSFCTSRDA
jgi:regulator of sigma E protease